MLCVVCFVLFGLFVVRASCYVVCLLFGVLCFGVWRLVFGVCWVVTWLCLLFVLCSVMCVGC